MEPKELEELRKAIEVAVPKALKEIGMKKFKEMSIFMSNKVDIIPETVAITELLEWNPKN